MFDRERDEKAERRLKSLLADHDLAVREYATRAGAIPETRWLAPRADGKWTPAQETQHLILAYEEFLRQLTQSTPVRLRGNPVRRRIARLIGLTSILWRKRIPVAVKAPRAVRPEAVMAGPEELIPRLRSRAADFESAFANEWRTNPARRMSHFLFGALTLDQGIRLISVHTRHHAAFLPLQPASSALSPFPSSSTKGARS